MYRGFAGIFQKFALKTFAYNRIENRPVNQRITGRFFERITGKRNSFDFLLQLIKFICIKKIGKGYA